MIAASVSTSEALTSTGLIDYLRVVGKDHSIWTEILKHKSYYFLWVLEILTGSKVTCAFSIALLKAILASPLKIDLA